MSKSFSYPNKGTCSKETHIVLNDDHTIESIEALPAAPAPPAALTRSPRTSSALWLSCNSQSVQKTTVLPLFPAGRTVVFLFIAIIKNSAYRNGIFAICNSTLLLLH